MSKGTLRLLQVEDSPDDAALVVAELASAGFTIDSLRVDNAQAMAAALDSGAWDLVISDYNLPSYSTEIALHQLQERQLDIPFIVVSGCIGEQAAVALMKAGAHDYIMKDNLARLAATVERELREAKSRQERHAALGHLAANEKLLREITSTLGEGLMVQDLSGKILFMNPEGERLLGWTEQELFTLDVHETIHYLHPDGSPLPREHCPILNIVCQGRPYRSRDDVFVRKGGTPFPVAYIATPIIDNDQVFAIVTSFHDISDLKQAEQDLVQSRQQLRELSVFLQTVREEERKRIARELHDELGQALTALRIDLNWLEARLPGAELPVADKLAAMESLIGKTVDSMRRISEDLRPGMLDDLGLAAAIEHHVEQFTERTGIPCKLEMNQDDFDLDDQNATAVFRILQETLTNVARHAAASEVRIEVRENDGEIRLTVQDNGNGLANMKERRCNSFGLLGMQERVKMLAGRLDLTSVPGQGTRIEATIPTKIKKDKQ